MRLFHFGKSDAPLVGAFHPAHQTVRSSHGVLLCAPFGDEAIRAHRPMRRLADQLALIGVPTLRFDYFGTGDSSGGCEEVTLDRWVEDVEVAAKTLSEMADIEQLVLIGVRLGATVACKASAALSPYGLVLWEPLLSGSDYWAEALEGGPGQHRQAGGFPVPDILYQEVATPDRQAMDTLPAQKLLVIGDEAAKAHYVDAAPHVIWAPPPDSFEWTTDDAMNSFRVPARSIDLIVDMVATWRGGGV